jgi:hypothetical protein
MQVWQFSRIRPKTSDESGSVAATLVSALSDFRSSPWRLHFDPVRQQLIVNDSMTDILGVERPCVRVLELPSLRTIRTHVSLKEAHEPLRFAVLGNWIAFPFSRQVIGIVDRSTDEIHRFDIIPNCTSDVEIVFNGMTPFSMILYHTVEGPLDKFQFRMVDFAIDLDDHSCDSKRN